MASGAAPEAPARVGADEAAAAGRALRGAPAAGNTSDADRPAAPARAEALPGDADALPVRLRFELEDAPLGSAALAFRTGDEQVDFVTDSAGAATVRLRPGEWTLALPERLAGRSGPFSVQGSRYDPQEPPGRVEALEPHQRLLLRVAPPEPEHEPTRGGVLSFGSDPQAALELQWTPAAAAGLGWLRLELLGPLPVGGRVLDARGSPLADAEVRVVAGEEGVAARSDGAGQVSLLIPAAWSPGSLAVEAQAPGRGRAATWLRARGQGSGGGVLAFADEDEDEDEERATPAPEGEGPFEPFELRLSAALGSLTGQVQDAAGRGLPARVEARYYSPGSAAGAGAPVVRLVTTCAADGRFNLEGIPAGARAPDCPGPRAAQVCLVATLEGWAPATAQVLVGAGTPLPTLVLSRLAPLRGVVLGPAGPVARSFLLRIEGPEGAPHGALQELAARQPLEGLLTAGDEAGRFVITDFPERGWLVVWGEGCAAALLEVHATSAPLELRLEAGGAILGRVLGPDGAPRGGATVSALPPGDRPRPEVALVNATSDPEGRFRLEHLPAGAAVRLRCQGHEAQAVVGQGEVLIDLARGGEGRATWRTVAAEDGQPLPAGPALVLQGRARWAPHPDERAFSFEDEGSGSPDGGLAGGGPAVFLARSPGRVPRRLEVTLRPGLAQDLGQVALAAGARLELDLAWPEAPARGVEVEWRAPEVGLAGRTSSPSPAQGERLLLSLEDGLPPGTPLELEVRLLPWDPGAAPPPARVERLTLAAGETRTVELDLR